jgi:alkanesulfonate monooxygenase SsuD/methylene tetrahydromethanopterin reductase-like flavin-dependent oxidoreductase (luciferase family)
MRLGVHLPVAGKGASPNIILQVAVEAERIGLDSVWSWERLMRPTVPIALGGAGGPVMDAPEMFGIVYDPIETLAYVAAQTSRITLGTSVLDALFQSPIILARRLATLDRTGTRSGRPSRPSAPQPAPPGTTPAHCRSCFR